MTSGNNQYEPPANNSILQGASLALTCQFTTNVMDTTDHNDLWRHNNGTNATTHINTHECATRPADHSGFITIHQTLWMQGMDPHASNVENKAT